MSDLYRIVKANVLAAVVDWLDESLAARMSRSLSASA